MGGQSAVSMGSLSFSLASSEPHRAYLRRLRARREELYEHPRDLHLVALIVHAEARQRARRVLSTRSSPTAPNQHAAGVKAVA